MSEDRLFDGPALSVFFPPRFPDPNGPEEMGPRAINDPKSVDDTLKIIDKALTDLRKIRFALDCARSEIRALSGRIYDET